MRETALCPRASDAAAIPARQPCRSIRLPDRLGQER